MRSYQFNYLATHNKLENRKTGELTEEGLRLQRMINPGIDWRKRNEQSGNHGSEDDM